MLHLWRKAPRTHIYEPQREVQVQRKFNVQMIRLLPILLIVGFAAEIASIIWVGRAVGVLGTLLLMFLGFVAGLALFRSTGVDMASALRGRLSSRESDKRFAARMILRVIAGLFLMIPGFFSDILAAILLLPPVQALLAAKMKIVTATSPDNGGYPSRGHTTVIEGDAVEIVTDSDQNPSP